MNKTDSFISRSNLIHQFKYDYTLTIFEKSTIKVKITCKEHGDFFQLPYNHLRGNGCEKCKIEQIKNKSFIQKCRDIHGNKYDYKTIKK